MEISGHNKMKVLRKSPRRRTGAVVFSIIKNESYHLPFFSIITAISVYPIFSFMTIHRVMEPPSYFYPRMMSL